MAIPQANVISTRDQYQSLTNQNLANFANTALSMYQLQSTIKQNNIANAEKAATEYVNSQLGGDWARFWRGTRTTDEEGNEIFEPNPLAKKLMETLYGKKQGSSMLDELSRRAEQTAAQQIQEAQDVSLRQPGVPAAAPQIVPPQVAPIGQSNAVPVSFTGNKQQIQKAPETQRMGVTGIKPEGEIPAANMLPAEPASSASAIPGTTSVRFGRGRSSSVMTTPALQKQETAAPRQDFQRNARGLPIAAGQETAQFPLNSQTLPAFEGIRAFNPNDPADYAQAMRELGNQLGGKEVGDFLAMGTTRYQTDPEYRKTYDAVAQRLLGVSGGTVIKLRNDILYNAQRGQPLLTPVNEEEKKNLWWYTGEGIPSTPGAQEVVAAVTNPNASTGTVNAAVSYFSKGDPKDMVRITVNDPQTIDSLISRALKTSFELEREGLSSGSRRSDIVGLPVGLTSVYQSMLTSAGNGTYSLVSKKDPRERAVLDRVSKAIARQVTPAAAMASNPAASQRASVDAHARVTAGMPLRIQDTMALSRDRLMELAQELNSDELTRIVGANVSEGYREDQRYREAVRQFNANLGISERQVAVAEGTLALNRQLAEGTIGEAAIDLAMKNLQLAALKAQAEGGSPDLTPLINFEMKVYENTTAELWEKAKSDPAAYQKLYQQAYENVTEFRAAVDNLAKMLAATSGTDYSVVNTILKSGWWVFGKNTPVSITVPSFSTPQPTVTATGAPSAGVTATAAPEPPQNPGQKGVDFANSFLGTQ